MQPKPFYQDLNNVDTECGQLEGALKHQVQL